MLLLYFLLLGTWRRIEGLAGDFYQTMLASYPTPKNETAVSLSKNLSFPANMWHNESGVRKGSYVLVLFLPEGHQLQSPN